VFVITTPDGTGGQEARRGLLATDPPDRRRAGRIEILAHTDAGITKPGTNFD
jgi:hypothetical protein